MATSRNLRDGTITIKDGKSTPSTVTIDLEDGNLSWTEHTPATFILDRGVLDHARKAPDVPCDVSFSMIFQSLSKHSTLTPYDGLTKTGGASTWTSEMTTDVYAVIIEFVVADPAGGNETITFTEFVPEEISVQEGDPDTMNVRGRARITRPSNA